MQLSKWHCDKLPSVECVYVWMCVRAYYALLGRMCAIPTNTFDPYPALSTVLKAAFSCLFCVSVCISAISVCVCVCVCVCEMPFCVLQARWLRRRAGANSRALFECSPLDTLCTYVSQYTTVCQANLYEVGVKQAAPKETIAALGPWRSSLNAFATTTRDGAVLWLWLR